MLTLLNLDSTIAVARLSEQQSGEPFFEIRYALFLISIIILDKEEQVMNQRPFDFGPGVRDSARFLVEAPEPQELEMLHGMSLERVHSGHKK